MVFINPKTDFAFKKIFGSPQSKDSLISLLNAFLYQERPIITDLEILDPYQAPRIKGVKDTYLDVKATIANGKTVVIEMQVLNVLGFEKRVLYNAAKAFAIQLDSGEDYTLLNPVIALTITDFEMFPHHPRIISCYQLKEKDDLTTYSDDIELVFVELPKFDKSLEELETLTDKWLYFLRYAQRLQAVPPSMETIPPLQRAFNVARSSNLSRQELEELERREMFIHDSRNAILKAQQVGEQIGEQRGLERGLEAGKELGRRQQAIATARQLLGVLDLETISRSTGLSVEELQALQQNQD
jgi:predicted transposase/invertase (TIGR01784 family)